MRTTRGPQRVDVIYRRIDDTYIDPLAFKADSLLGVPGIFDVYRSGGVTLCSAPGAGVADDKAIYVFVPDMIELYLGEKPILENVQTWRCAQPDDCKYVLDNLKDLVVQARPRLGRLWHADRAACGEEGNRRVPRQDQGEPQRVHRSADARPLDGADPWR